MICWQAASTETDKLSLCNKRLQVSTLVRECSQQKLTITAASQGQSCSNPVLLCPKRLHQRRPIYFPEVVLSVNNSPESLVLEH